MNLKLEKGESLADFRVRVRKMDEAKAAAGEVLFGNGGLTQRQADALNAGLTMLLKPCTGRNYTGAVATRKG